MKKRKDLFRNPLLIDFKAYYSNGESLHCEGEELSFPDFERLYKKLKMKMK